MSGLRPPQTVRPAEPKKGGGNDDSSDEEIKIMSEKTKKYMTQHKKKEPATGPRNYRKQPSNQPIPPGYRCHRCKIEGHLISDCPTNGDPKFDIMKPNKGQPTNLKKEDLTEQVEDKFIKTLLNDEITHIDVSLGIMDEFKCLMCMSIFTDPSIVPCCRINFCRE